MRMLLRVTIPHETFNADVQFPPVISAGDLARADLTAPSKKSAS